MKTLKMLMGASLLLCLIVISSCDNPHPCRTCRIDKVYWEDEWHKAYYSSSGRLVKLEAAVSKIFFHYNGSDQLISAEIYTGDPEPSYTFEFTHGPFGIVGWDMYDPFDFRRHLEFHYASPAVVDYVVESEYGSGPGDPPTFVIRKDLSYSSQNVMFVSGTVNGNPFTGYTGSAYDKKTNPFKLLAQAVGNPVFFPVCNIVSFPVVQYDVSYLNLFSKNNPGEGMYEVPVGSGDPEVQQQQDFTYVYTASYVESLVWSDELGDTNKYAFSYTCGFSSAED
jgi:hypothetical protein